MNDATNVVKKDTMPKIVLKNGTENAKIVSVMTMKSEIALRYAINVVPWAMFQEIALRVKTKNANFAVKEVIHSNFVEG